MLEEFALQRAVIDELADQIAICAARIDAGLHQLLVHIRRFDALKGWVKQGSKTCAHWLSWRIGLGMVAAREKVRVATALESLPLIDAALARGELSYAKVRAITRVANARNEDLLLAQARGTTGAELERICAGFRKVLQGRALDEERRYVRRRTMQDGTVQIEMRLLPDEAEEVWQALGETRRALRKDFADSAESAKAPPTHPSDPCASADSAEAHPGRETAAAPSMADAAVAMAAAILKAASSLAPGGAAADRRTLFLHLSERRIRASEAGQTNAGEAKVSEAAPWKAELQDGTPLSGATLLRLACDSGLVVARTNDRGNVLDIGRRRRTVPPAISRALRLRDRGCRFPGCGHAAFVDAHHVEHWAHGGATSLRNLVLVCHGHHVALHEGGFRAERERDGELRFIDPDGCTLEPVPRAPTVSANSATLMRDEQHARGIRIDRGTSLVRRSFMRPDLGGCVRALAWRQWRGALA